MLLISFVGPLGEKPMLNPLAKSNRVGPVGLVQPLADIVKLAGKEMFRPQAAIPFLFAIAPALVIFSGIITLAILPFGNVQDGVGLYGIDVSIGVLYFFAFSSRSSAAVRIGTVGCSFSTAATPSSGI